MVVFDLDPGTGADIIDCAEVAVWLRDVLAKHPLKCFPKTSGSKGLQVYVPLNGPVSFTQTKRFAREVADRLTAEHPDKVLARMEKRLRQGKVFIDWSQNDRHKTTVCVYSLRAKEHPTVSTPLEWDEVAKALKAGDPKRLSFETADTLERVKKVGDIFKPVLQLKQKLPAPQENAGRSIA
jgi:bifunctional non-homologous end joining protein LigD